MEATQPPGSREEERCSGDEQGEADGVEEVRHCDKEIWGCCLDVASVISDDGAGMSLEWDRRKEKRKEKGRSPWRQENQTSKSLEMRRLADGPAHG